MKTDPLAAIVSLALTLMTGAVLNHWAGLDERIQLARNAAAQNPGQPVIQTVAPQPWFVSTSTPAKPASAQPSGNANTDQRILSLVERMQNQQEELRDQVAEANRDLMELQFRVDTHSESFRPLRATQEPDPSIPSGPGVLPPIEAP
jgi:hypothetical protein